MLIVAKQKQLIDYGHYLKATLKQWTGLPVSVGIATTKTLAKLANQVAKKNKEGVFSFNDPQVTAMWLQKMPVNEVWGIGKQSYRKFEDLGFTNVQQLYDSNLQFMRKHFGIVGERIVQELRGVSCLNLNFLSDRKNITSSRSFGKLLTDREPIEEALSYYASKACAKLRQQHSLAQGIHVFLSTNRFKANLPQYRNSMVCTFATPTNNTSHIINAAKSCLEQLFKAGYSYQKTGITLLNLVNINQRQGDLFADQSEATKNPLMTLMDKINRKMGEDKLFVAAEGIKKPWRTKSDHRSPCYTTKWQELVTVLCA